MRTNQVQLTLLSYSLGLLYTKKFQQHNIHDFQFFTHLRHFIQKQKLGQPKKNNTCAEPSADECKIGLMTKRHH